MSVSPDLDCTVQIACISFVQVLTMECRRFWDDLALVVGHGGWSALGLMLYPSYAHVLYTS